MSSRMLEPGGIRISEAALPAAPAAVCQSLTVLQAHSQILQLRQQQLCDNPTSQPAAAALPERALDSVLRALALLANHVVHTNPTMPGAAELLLLPEFVSCLAIVLLVAVLGLDTGDGVEAKHAASSSSSGSGSGSSTGRQSFHTGRQQQRAGSSGGRGSSSGGGSSGGRGSSSGGGSGNSTRDKGVRVDSLTPLSCSLFGVLGIAKETALQAVVLAKSLGLSTASSLTVWLTAYRTVARHQVGHLVGSRG
jgi:hypothetical protein